MGYNDWESMELFLNLTWLTISIALGALLVVSISRCESASDQLIHSRRTAWISYLLLIALLLPAISMTDDLMAMAAPTDSEQIVRRYEASATGHHVAIPVIAPYFPISREFFPAHFQTLGLVSIHSYRTSQFQQSTCVQDRAPPAIV